MSLTAEKHINFHHLKHEVVETYVTEPRWQAVKELHHVLALAVGRQVYKHYPSRALQREAENEAEDIYFCWALEHLPVLDQHIDAWDRVD